MEIKWNSNIDPVVRAGPSPIKARAPQAGTDSVAFDQVEVLDQALRATAAGRPEMIGRARQLIGNVKYPPEETIQRIATLLAMSLDDDTEGSA